MSERITYLINQFTARTISNEEKTELFTLLHTEVHDEDFKAALDQVWFNTDADQQMNEERARIIFANITGAEVVEMPAPAKRRTLIRWIAAACIIALVGIATYTVISNHSEKSPTVATTPTDITAPQNTRAVITLADGSKVYLDSAGNGTIAQENNVNVVKNANGGIEYLSPAGGGEPGKVSPVGGDLEGAGAYNTLYNPRGSKVISLTLSDGTKVWLNAESSLRYPASFAPSAVREVEITGEAYFEVAHIDLNAKNAKDAQRTQRVPFIVKKGDVSVTVLGTHFNVNAYDDESDIKVTLLEGSVKVSATSAKNSASSAFIKPGQQAVVILRQAQDDNKILVQDNIDVDQVMAWKNGLFSLKRADIKTVMQQIARWYDVDVEYKTDITERFIVKIARNTNLSNVIKILEATGAVHFKIEGKKVIVMK